jgi:hypothetical protein
MCRSVCTLDHARIALLLEVFASVETTAGFERVRVKMPFRNFYYSNKHLESALAVSLLQALVTLDLASLAREIATAAPFVRLALFVCLHLGPGWGMTVFVLTNLGWFPESLR